MVREYKTPAAFRVALDTRLRSPGVGLQRRRQLLVFDRLLARIDHHFGDVATLKGGLVLEVRLERARTTKDVDLHLTGSPQTLLDDLQEAGRLDLKDFMTFEVQPDAQHSEIQGDGMVYEGKRFRAECKIGGKLFGAPFGIDVGFADPILGEPDVVEADDTLDFIGVPPPRLRLYPVESHIAEKLHAFTMPRDRPNSRVKDLPDLALLGMTEALSAKDIHAAISLTFDFRKTHPIPGSIPNPPGAWAAPYRKMAATDALAWENIEAVTDAVRAFLDPVLAGIDGRWNKDEWLWIQQADPPASNAPH